jgi:hypothetical protein
MTGLRGLRFSYNEAHPTSPGPLAFSPPSKRLPPPLQEYKPTVIVRIAELALSSSGLYTHVATPPLKPFPTPSILKIDLLVGADYENQEPGPLGGCRLFQSPHLAISAFANVIEP